MFLRISLFCLIIYVNLLCFSTEASTIHKRKAANLCKFNTIVVFGDSTCDNGNTWRLTNYTYPPTEYYYKGRFSNGKTWVEYLAASCKAKLNNYAYGGATTDTDFVQSVSGLYDNTSVPGIKQEINDIFFAQVSSKSVNFDRTLFIVGHQGNDYLDNPKVLPWDVVKILYEQWVALANYGAKNILINKFFNFEYLPEVTKNYGVFKRLLSALISDIHNGAIDFYVWRFRRKYKDVNLYILPMDKIWENVQKPSVKEELGFTDLSSACVSHVDKTDVFTVCSNPGEHFYWDHIHPSTKAHQFVGMTAYNVITGTY